MRSDRVRSVLPAAFVSFLLAAPSQAQDGGGLREIVAPFVRAHCVACHSGEDAEGGLDLDRFLRAPQGADWLADVLLVRDVLDSGEMPPPDAEAKGRPVPQPSAVDRDRVVAWASATLAAGEERDPVDPGRVTLRRLSRLEYRNAVRDTLGVDVLDLVDGFPADDLSHGFDNLGDARSTSALHVEKYADAAARIAQRAVLSVAPGEAKTRSLGLDRFELFSGSMPRVGESLVFTRGGAVVADVQVERNATYRIVIAATGDQAGPDPVRMRVFHERDGTYRTFDVAESRSARESGSFRVDVDLLRGRHRIGVEFANDYFRPDAADPGQRDRNLYVRRVDLVGPVANARPTWAEARIFMEDPGADRSLRQRSRVVVEGLLRRLWRRRPSNGSVRRIAKLVEREAEEVGFHWAMQLGVQAALTSPFFLFRVERAVGPKDAIGGRALDGWSMANRLSFLIWSSAPDDRLLARAENGDLGDLNGLLESVDRLLSDARADALVQNFAAQWLELRALQEVNPDPQRFPSFDEELARSMRRETEALLRDNFRERRPLRELLSARHTFVDERLALHYGLRGVYGDDMRRVELPNDTRGGLLTHASILTITSNPTRTSPVKRGKWILDNILGTPPSPPPPSVDALPEEDVGDAAVSLRQLLERHRADPSCAVCHARMDAFGLALEHYDAVGRWRLADPAGGLIDASVALPGHQAIDGSAGLVSVLVQDGALVRTALRKLFVFGVGRPTTGPDEVVLERVARRLGVDASLVDIVKALIQLDAFRRVRVE